MLLRSYKIMQKKYHLHFSVFAFYWLNYCFLLKTLFLQQQNKPWILLFHEKVFGTTIFIQKKTWYGMWKTVFWSVLQWEKGFFLICTRFTLKCFYTSWEIFEYQTTKKLSNKLQRKQPAKSALDLMLGRCPSKNGYISQFAFFFTIKLLNTFYKPAVTNKAVWK